MATIDKVIRAIAAARELPKPNPEARYQELIPLLDKLNPGRFIRSKHIPNKPLELQPGNESVFFNLIGSVLEALAKKVPGANRVLPFHNPQMQRIERIKDALETANKTSMQKGGHRWAFDMPSVTIHEEGPAGALLRGTMEAASSPYTSPPPGAPFLSPEGNEYRPLSVIRPPYDLFEYNMDRPHELVRNREVRPGQDWREVYDALQQDLKARKAQQKAAPMPSEYNLERQRTGMSQDDFERWIGRARP